MRRTFGIVATLCVVVAAPAWATDLFDPAPPLKVAEWVKGQPVELKDGKGKNVYVVEFWATWCGPCRATIPHLTELQKKYKDKGVVFIGVSDEPVEKVRPFVSKQGDRMDYTVAVDADKATSKLYMEAFKQGGIPHLFIVDKEGRIAWHDHPQSPDLESVLDKVIAGKFDKAAADAIRQTRQAKEKEQARLMEVAQNYYQAVTTQPDPAKAKELGAELLKSCKEPEMLNAISWGILTDEGVKNRDIELALKLAESAVRESGGKNAAIVDTYARALFDSGKVKEAIEQQRKAIELSKDDPDMQKELQETLARYEAKRK